MNKLEDEKLKVICGGADISSTMINAVTRLITSVIELGRIIGSSIYRYQNKNYCR